MLELVGRYEIQERIGEGAMADVYRAYDPSIRRPLAIKVLKAQYRAESEYAQRFLREAKAAGALSHPNIVTIYDVGEVDGFPYIAMELLAGEPLNEVMTRSGRMEPETTLQIGLQLADALRYSHALGVVHRDIKPSNIMLGADGRSVKILDFGIARVHEAEGLLEADHLKTQIGQVLGTPRYMSPEQAMGQEIDGRSDLFSVGVVLYEMLTGRKAFGGGSAATLALQITQNDPEPISQLAPDCPRGLQFIVNKLLAKRPDRRFSDGEQLAQALRREQAVLDTVRAEGASRSYLPLQVRVALMMAAVTATVLFVSIGLAVGRQNKAMQQMAVTSGVAITSFVANNAALRAADNATLPAAKQDWLPVQAFVKAAAADPNVISVTVVDAEGVVRGASDEAKLGDRYQALAAGSEDQVGDVSVEKFKGPDGHSALRFTKPIEYAGRNFGSVDVGLSSKALDTASAVTTSAMTLLGLVVFGVVAAAAYFVSRMLAKPLLRLRQAVEEAAAGNLDFRLSHNRVDEFGDLFESFNRLCATMQERIENVEAIALDATPVALVDLDEHPVAATPLADGPWASRPSESDRTMVHVKSSRGNGD